MGWVQRRSLSLLGSWNSFVLDTYRDVPLQGTYRQNGDEGVEETKKHNFGHTREVLDLSCVQTKICDDGGRCRQLKGLGLPHLIIQKERGIGGSQSPFVVTPPNSKSKNLKMGQRA